MQEAERVRDLPLHRAIDLLRKLFPPDLAGAALEMVELRRRALSKFSRAQEMLFTPEGLEQSSSEVVSLTRATRFPGGAAVTDLCCGMGGDAISLSRRNSVRAVDRDPAALACAEWNAAVYGCSISPILADVLDYPLETGRAFIDPSRRAGGRRRRRGEEYSPPLSFALNLADRLQGLGIKVSPALDLPPLAEGWEVEAVSLDGVCRELALWSGDLAAARRRATVLRSLEACADTIGVDAARSGAVVPGSSPGFSFKAWTLASTEDSDPPAAVMERPIAPGDTLVEPDPAVIRGRLVGLLAGQIDARLIDSQVAYLISQSALDTPFGSAFRVLDSFPYGEKRLKQWLQARRVGHLIVKKRGFPLSPEEVIQRMRLRGDESATVILTRQGERHLVIAVERVAERMRATRSSADG